MIRRRLFALFLDYCVILGWLAFLAAVVGLAYAAGIRWTGSTDIVAFVASVLPVWLYFTVTEAGPRHATWGKRRAGLRVEGGSTPRMALRNAVKLLPWELAHLGITPLWGGSGALLSPGVAWIPISAAYLLIGVSATLLLLRSDRAALHDLIAGTRVVAA